MLAIAMGLVRRFSLVIRFYGVGIVNTAFGFGLYSALVLLGLNLYVAQIVAHVTGTAFNYFMFKKHVFIGYDSSLLYYVAAYSANYLIGLVSLFLAHKVIGSPIADGFISLLATSSINFLVLKRFVFTKQTA